MLRPEDADAAGADIAWATDRIDRLRTLIERADYRGHDPFDLVNSPLLAVVPTRWRYTQLAISKFGSRVAPDALRRLLRVPPIEDAKIYCCAYLGYALLGDDRAARHVLDRMAEYAEHTPDGGAAWGYDYLWATRQGANPRRASTLVPGSFAMLALIDRIVTSGDETHRPLLDRALDHYATRHLCQGSGGPFLGYFVGTATNTHNANLLGCAALSLGSLVTERPELAQTAADALGATLSAIRDDGYLEYADHPSGAWTDGFHHLYVIAALTAVAWANPLVDHERCADALDRLRAYWDRHFRREDDLVNYFPDALTPIDPHNFAVTALCSMLLDGHAGVPYAQAILRRVDSLAWDERRGRYIHRIHRRRRDTRTFLRWTQAWMFAALCAAAAPDRLLARAGAYAQLREVSAR